MPAKNKRNAPRLSRHRKPADLEVGAWQAALRRQFGREQKFSMRNVGDEPVFSEFVVTNPRTMRRLYIC